jgi:hypothetical protein
LFIITYTIKEGLPVVGYRRYPYKELEKVITRAGFRMEGARSIVAVTADGVVLSKKDADLSEVEKEGRILYIRGIKV